MSDGPARAERTLPLESAVPDGPLTPPERPPRPQRVFSTPDMRTSTPLAARHSTSPGLRERFSRLFSREATVGEDSVDGGAPSGVCHSVPLSCFTDFTGTMVPHLSRLLIVQTAVRDNHVM